MIRFTGRARSSPPGMPPSRACRRTSGRDSSDQGKTWTPVSGIDEFDYHELEVHAGRLFAFPETARSRSARTAGARSRRVRRRPRPRRWTSRSTPRTPRTGWSPTQSSTFTSTNKGRSWRERHDARLEPAPRLRTSAGKLFAVGLDEHNPRGADEPAARGRRRACFERHIRQEVAAAPGDGTLFAITASSKVRRSPDGVRSQQVAQVTWSARSAPR